MAEMTRPKVDRFSRAHLEAKRFRTKETKVPDPFTGNDIEDPWYYYDRLVRGYHWDFLTRKATWVSTPVKNSINTGIANYTTMLTDNEPIMSIVPREERDTEEADVISAAVKYWWTDLEAAQTKIMLAVKSSRTFCIGWLRTYRDEDHPHTGLKMVPAEHVWVDPDCTVDNFDPAYLIYEYRGLVSDLKNRYPKPAEGSWDDFDPEWKSGQNYNERVDRDRYDDNKNPAKNCAIYEMWYKSDSREFWDDNDSVPGKTVKKSKKASPGGRRAIYAGGICLEDEKNPYAHNEFPFTPIHADPLPGRFYGDCEPARLLNPQLMRNRMSQFIFDQTVKAGGGYILVGQGSQIDPAEVKNAPLQILPCRDVNAFRIVAPPTPSRHVFNYIDLLDADMQDILGLHDISQGGTIPSHTTAQAVQQMTQSDRTRVRSGSRWLTWAVRRMLRQVISNWAQWPDFKWMLAIAGKDEVPDSESETGSSIPDQTFIEFDPAVLKAKFKPNRVAYDIAVEDTSMLPALQQDKNNQLAMWLQLGLVSPEEVMKFGLVDMPNRDAILAQRAAAPPPAPAMPEAGMPPGMTPPMAPPQGAPIPPEAMQPGPGGMQDMTPEMFEEAIAQMAAEQGISEEELIAQMTAALQSQGFDSGMM